MADQTAILYGKYLSGPQAGQDINLRVLAKDTDATLSQFPDLGSSITSWVPSGDVLVSDFILAANTATITRLKPLVDTIEKAKQFLTAALSNLTTIPQTRIGSAFVIKAGTTFQLIGRA